jgi:hypothetical protein
MVKRKVRRYSETERLGAMSLAVVTNPATASEQTGIPVTTIVTWCDKQGGLIKVRSYLEAAAIDSLAAAKRALSVEMIRRMKELPDGEFAQTFRELLVAASKAGQADAPVAAQQQSQAIIVNIYDSDDEVRKDGHTIIEGEASEAGPPGDGAAP